MTIFESYSFFPKRVKTKCQGGGDLTFQSFMKGIKMSSPQPVE